MNIGDIPRDQPSGRLPKYAWPGGYPMYYVTDGGLVVCADCASDEDTSDPAVAGDVHWEGEPLICEDQGEEIPSAYGIPDA